MAERRAAGFNIPLNFYDGGEVNSIPKRVRAAAIGVWALAGDYSATQLTDGYVGPEMLRTFGCTPPIRAALKATTNSRGEHSPLWEEARDGGVQLTNWPKWQRTRAEVTTYRESEAERKKAARDAKREQLSNNSRPTVAPLSTNSRATVEQLSSNSHATVDQLSPIECESRVSDSEATTSSNAKTSARTSAGRPQNVRSTKTETKTETETKSLSVETSRGGVTSGDAHDPRPECLDHEQNSDTPCPACRRRREWDNAHAERLAADELDARRRARDTRDNCPTCHGTNWIPDTDPAVKCDHQEAVNR